MHSNDINASSNNPVAFSYYHDRTFFVQKEIDIISRLSIATGLFMESLTTSSMLNSFLVTFETITSTLNTILPLPSFIKAIKPGDSYYRPIPPRDLAPIPPINNIFYHNNGLLSPSVPSSTFLMSIIQTPLFYILGSIIFIFYIFSLHTHIHIQSYFRSHIAFLHIHAGLIIGLHYCFIVMYRYYIYDSLFWNFFLHFGPFLIQLFHGFQHILFGCFPDPFVFIKSPSSFVVCIIYLIYICSGWLLVGDLIKGDIITLFVIFLLPLFVFLYYIKSTLELYTMIGKQQSNHILHIKQERSDIEKANSSPKNNTKTIKSPEELTPDHIFPVQPLKLAHSRFFELLFIYSWTFLTSFAAKPLGISSIYLSIILSWLGPALYSADFWSHPITIQRTVLPGWMKELNWAEIYHQNPDQYSYTDDMTPPNEIVDDDNNDDDDVNDKDIRDSRFASKKGKNREKMNEKIELHVKPQVKFKETRHGTYTALSPQNNNGGGDSDFDGEFSDHSQAPYPPPAALPKTKNGPQIQSKSDSDDISSDDWTEKRQLNNQNGKKTTQSSNNDGETQWKWSEDEKISDENDPYYMYQRYMIFNRRRMGCHASIVIFLTFSAIFLAILITSGQIGLFSEPYDHYKPNVYTFLPSNQFLIQNEIYQNNKNDQSDQNGQNGQNNQYNDSFSPQQIDFGAHDTTTAIPVNPELEQTIENIYQSPTLSSGWANIGTGCFGHSSITGKGQFDFSEENIGIKNTKNTKNTKNAKNTKNTKKWRGVPVETDLRHYENDITASRLSKNIELNMIKQLYFEQFKGIRNYKSKYQDELKTNMIELNENYPKIHFDEIVSVVRINVLGEIDQNDHDEGINNDGANNNNNNNEQNVEKIAQQPDMTVLYTISPYIPRLSPSKQILYQKYQNQKYTPTLEKVSPTANGEISQSPPDQSIPELSTEHISLILPYHLLYSLYTKHYSTFAHDNSKNHSSTKQERQKYLLDAINLPIRARWHSYASVASIDEYFIKCVIDGDNSHNGIGDESTNGIGYTSNEEVFIKVHLLSYLSCDQHIAQSIIINEDVSMLKKCFKSGTPMANPVLNEPIQEEEGEDDKSGTTIIGDDNGDNDDKNNQNKSESKNDNNNNNDSNVDLAEQIYFKNSNVNIAMRFLLSHFDSIVKQHDRSSTKLSETSYDKMSPSSTGNINNNDDNDDNHDNHDVQHKSTQNAKKINKNNTQNKNNNKNPQKTPLIISPQETPSTSSSTQLKYANLQTISTPLPPYVTMQIDYANRYFAITLLMIVAILSSIFTLMILLQRTFPSLRYVD
jgi:hypothetical protein